MEEAFAATGASTTSSVPMATGLRRRACLGVDCGRRRRPARAAADDRRSLPRDQGGHRGVLGQRHDRPRLALKLAAGRGVEGAAGARSRFVRSTAWPELTQPNGPWPASPRWRKGAPDADASGCHAAAVLVGGLAGCSSSRAVSPRRPDSGGLIARRERSAGRVRRPAWGRSRSGPTPEAVEAAVTAAPRRAGPDGGPAAVRADPWPTNGWFEVADDPISPSWAVPGRLPHLLGHACA